MDKKIDIEATAIALFALAEQLEAAYPGLAQRYGWARLGDLETLAAALNDVNNATKPDGLQ